jgi:predicted dehydrogenase
VADRLGCEQVRIDAGGPEDMPDDVFKVIVEGYNDVISRAKDKGIEVITENHFGPSRIPANVEKMVTEIEGLGFLYDTHNWKPELKEEGRQRTARLATATHVKTFAWDADGNESAARSRRPRSSCCSTLATRRVGHREHPDRRRRDRERAEDDRPDPAYGKLTEPMSEKIRIGMIGCGQIAQQHLVRYATMSDRVSLVAASDINEACASETGAKYAIPHVYANFREMLKRDDLDAIDVCLHNNLHRPATEAALRAGKHVYCEKPMAGSYRDAEAMLKMAKETGRKLSIQLAQVFAPETRAAKELIDARRAGRGLSRAIDGLSSSRPAVRGRLWDADVRAEAQQRRRRHVRHGRLPHLAHPVPDGQPERHARVGQDVPEDGMDETRRKTSGYDVEELGLGLVRFAGGVTMDLIESWAIHLDSFEGSFVVGSKGGVRIEPFGFFRSYGDLDVSGTATSLAPSSAGTTSAATDRSTNPRNTIGSRRSRARSNCSDRGDRAEHDADLRSHLPLRRARRRGNR